MKKIFIYITFLFTLVSCGANYTLFNPFIDKETPTGGIIWSDKLFSNINKSQSVADQNCQSRGYATAKLRMLPPRGEFYNVEFICTNDRAVASNNTSYVNSNSAFTTTTSSSSALNAIEHGLSMLDRKVYSDSKPILFYDNSLNSMRKCIGDVIAGTCTNYAPYNSADYDFNTLFYNPKTGAMQKCLNEVLGSCGNFSPQANPMAGSKEQLFYNPRTRSMSTCLNANNSGQCLAFGISPSTNRSNQTRKANPYYFKAPETPSDSIQKGLDMLGGKCTLGRNC